MNRHQHLDLIGRSIDDNDSHQKVIDKVVERCKKEAWDFLMDCGVHIGAGFKEKFDFIMDTIKKEP